MFNTVRPTDQRAGVKPIAFVLQTDKGVQKSVTLKIRPEDLTRTEVQRVTTIQTMGREEIGWADNFGAGLPTLNIAGNTGWRSAQGSGMDGAQAFEELNTLVMETYPQKVQEAIDNGRDPQDVKLLFVDMLDDFSWVVVPQQFILRRSKSRPLLFQYTIQMQCVSTDIENPMVILPTKGDIPSGLKALDDVVSKIEGFGSDIEGWINDAVRYKDTMLQPIGNTVKRFTEASARIFKTVSGVISTGQNAINSVGDDLIGLASDFAQVGMNVNRTIGAIAGIPQDLRHSIMRVAGAYSEAFCIFNNSLKPRKSYQNYDGLFGASNCSSTSGGNAPSAYANTNVFAKMTEGKMDVGVNAGARAALKSVALQDPVLAPSPENETNRLLEEILAGTPVSKIEQAALAK